MVVEAGEFYAVDLPYFSSLKSEVHNWYTKWKTEEKDNGSSVLPSPLSSTLPKIFGFYPNIKVLVTVVFTLPVTSGSAECSFGGLKHIKTVFRSSMGNVHLFSLALSYQ